MSTGRILRAGEGGPRFLYAGQDMHVLAEPMEGFGAFSAGELVAPPNFSGPIPHVHDTFDEALCVVEGRLLVTYGTDEPVEAEVGSFCLAPRGVRHTFSNPDDTSVRILGLWAPGKEGLDFMRAVGTVLPAVGPPDPDAVRDAYLSNGSRLLP